jgi:hypothetical protein
MTWTVDNMFIESSEDRRKSEIWINIVITRQFVLVVAAFASNNNQKKKNESAFR